MAEINLYIHFRNPGRAIVKSIGLPADSRRGGGNIHAARRAERLHRFHRDDPNVRLRARILHLTEDEQIRVVREIRFLNLARLRVPTTLFAVLSFSSMNAHLLQTYPNF